MTSIMQAQAMRLEDELATIRDMAIVAALAVHGMTCGAFEDGNQDVTAIGSHCQAMAERMKVFEAKLTELRKAL
jgi:hypothetical protein